MDRNEIDGYAGIIADREMRTGKVSFEGVPKRCVEQIKQIYMTKNGYWAFRTMEEYFAYKYYKKSCKDMTTAQEIEFWNVKIAEHTKYATFQDFCRSRLNELTQ